MPFVVEFREDVDVTPLGLTGVEDFVNIGIIEDEHGSHVAGITSANNMFGNPNLDGVAPGAKLVSARACNWGGGCTAAALTDGMVELVTRRGVDVVNMSIGGLPALNDGNNARAELYNRLIDDFGVQIVLSAGNSGPGLNTIGDPAVADNAISAAASISKETWLSNYGSVTRVPYQLFNFSSRGPAEDGGPKPTVAAPGSAVSTTPLWQPGVPVPEAGYALPPGYQMINGTSMASPQTAGGVALLLSAAKATDKGLTPAAIRRAIASSADWINGATAAGQGSGKLGHPRRLEPAQGQAAGDPGLHRRRAGVHRDLRFPRDARPGHRHLQPVRRRRGRPAGRPDPHLWREDHAHERAGRNRPPRPPVGRQRRHVQLGRRVDLPLNRAVRVDVTVEATDGRTARCCAWTTRRRRPSTTRCSTPSWCRTRHGGRTTRTPPVARSIGTTTSPSSSPCPRAPRRCRSTCPASRPARRPASSRSTRGASRSTTPTASFCYTNFSDPATCKPQERSYENPLPGVWEIEVESRRTSPALVNPFNLTARIQGVTVEPAIVELPSVEAGVPTPVEWTVTNNFGPVTVTGAGGPLGSARVERPTIADHELQTYEVVVPAGASRLEVAIGNTSDLAADLDLFVRFNGAIVAQAADGDSEEAVTINNPTPGVYTVEVDGFAVPAGTTAYDYRDVFYSPSLGEVSTSGAAVTLANGASATITGSVTALSVPAEGRQLFGELRVVTDEGAVVGRGNVSIGTVTGG